MTAPKIPPQTEGPVPPHGVLAPQAAASDVALEVLEQITECVKMVGPDGTLLHMNSSGLRMVGAASAAAVLGKNVYDLVAAEFRDAFRSFNERICAGEKGSLEYDIINLQNERHQMETNAVPFPRPDGSVVHLAITRDLTDRNRKERAALLLAAIVDSSDDAIISKDLDGIITSWNISAERLFGYTAAEVVGKPITILIPPDRLDEEPQILARLRRGERVDHFETVRRRKDGTLLDISLTISPVRDAQGRVIGASKIARNITQVKRAERAALQLSAIVDSSDDAIISKDLNGIIMSWNNSAERVFGYTADEVIGKPITILIPLDRQDEEPNILSRLRRGERVDHFETVRRRKDGTLLDISLTISPIRDAQGRIIGASKIARDISDRKRIERAIQELNEQLTAEINEQKRVEDELRRANQDLEQFAFSASHDLQEPLRGIKINSQLLARRYAAKFDGQAHDFLQSLIGNASRMEALIHDLLAYTQVARLDVSEEITDSNDALASTLASLNGSIAESGARISSDSLPSVRIHDTHLKQLFQNLIGNAIKYRSRERVPIVHVSAMQQAGNWLFSVTDNGIGIEPEYKERVFGLFKRLHTSDEYSGTGIGLALCQRIVERYHGRIWVESEPGCGSKFTFTLPV